MSVPPITHHSINNFSSPHNCRIPPDYITEARDDEYYGDDYEGEVEPLIFPSRHHEQPITYD